MNIKGGGQELNGVKANGLIKKATNSYKSEQMYPKDGDGKLIGKFNLLKILTQRDFNMPTEYQTYIIRRLGRKM